MIRSFSVTIRDKMLRPLHHEPINQAWEPFAGMSRYACLCSIGHRLSLFQNGIDQYSESIKCYDMTICAYRIVLQHA